MDDLPQTRHNPPLVRGIAVFIGLLLLALAALLLWRGITGFTDEATSGDMSGRDALASLLTVAAGGASLVLSLAAARVGEVL